MPRNSLNKPIVDGTIDWSGGFDSNRSPSVIDQNQYTLGVNVDIPQTFGGISNRRGLRCINIEFENNSQEEIYRNGNIQGEGWYFDGKETKMLVSVGGWIFEFSFVNKFNLKAKIINLAFQNNPNNLYCWITRIPDGAIVNDGESLPIYVIRSGARRTIPKNQEIGTGLMGCYVQNRFFYVKQNRKFIIASEINNPISIREAIDDNIYGFMAPEDEDFITAIGRAKTIQRDALGGNLAFATRRNNYSVDVRGPRTGWGQLAGRGVGFVDNSVPDIGACSSYSYEPFNGNIYFRNTDFGLCSTKRSQYQFINQDTYASQSLEANIFFNRDTEALLSKCYTRGHKNKIYTTVAPELKFSGSNGFIFHNGIIVYAPDIYYSDSKKAPRRYESVYTGIRPWCITVVDDYVNQSLMYIHSYDKDGVNRLYLFDESIDHDIDKDGNKVEIQSKILTRAFAHGNESSLKAGIMAYYSVRGMSRDCQIRISTRTSETGAFIEQSLVNHKVANFNFTINKQKEKCFNPIPVHPEDRDLFKIKADPSNKNGGGGCIGGPNYFIRQDLIETTGPFTLKRLVRIAELVDVNQKIICEEKVNPINSYRELSLYDYKL